MIDQQEVHIHKAIENQLADEPGSDTVYVTDIFGGDAVPNGIEHKERTWRLDLFASDNRDHGTAVYKSGTLFDGPKA